MMSPVRDTISDNAGSTCTSTPTITNSAIAVPIPAMAVRIARRSSGKSPKAGLSANAMFGPSNGAITIAPMMLVTLLCANRWRPR